LGLVPGSHQVHRRLVAIHEHHRLRIEQPDRVGAALEQELKHGLILLQRWGDRTGPFVPLSAVCARRIHQRVKTEWLSKVSVNARQDRKGARTMQACRRSSRIALHSAPLRTTVRRLDWQHTRIADPRAFFALQNQPRSVRRHFRFSSSI